MRKSIVVENLSKNYFNKEAVKEISFKINENEILGLLGPNGCGKTTTIAMMLGLLEPTKGRVIIHGQDIEKNRNLNFITSPRLTKRKNLLIS